ncbi:MAG: radical SAM protein, partial [Deltaproteobacteria bacterium]
MGWLNLADWLPCTEVEGPGKRFALWVQGCHLRCPGCCNPGMFAFIPRRLVATNLLLARILEAAEREGIEGVTMLGGEPLLQARGLAEVAQGCQAHGLSVIVFTGYTLEELEEASLPGVPELLASTDLLIDGRYLASAPEGRRNWVGSTNQRFHYLTDRYAPSIETDARFSAGIELRFQRDGTLGIHGAPRLISPRD